MHSTLWALAGALVGLAVCRVMLRRRLLATATVTPSDLKRLDLTLALLGILLIPIGVFSSKVPITESGAWLLLTCTFLVGTITLLPVQKIRRPASTFLIAGGLLLGREQALEWAATRGTALKHVFPLVYGCATIALLLSGGLFVLRNAEFLKRRPG